MLSEVHVGHERGSLSRQDCVTQPSLPTSHIRRETKLVPRLCTAHLSVDQRASSRPPAFHRESTFISMGTFCGNIALFSNAELGRVEAARRPKGGIWNRL